MSNDARAQWQEVGRLLDMGADDIAIALARQLVTAGVWTVASRIDRDVLLRLRPILERRGVRGPTSTPLAGSEPMLPPQHPEADDT